VYRGTLEPQLAVSAEIPRGLEIPIVSEQHRLESAFGLEEGQEIPAQRVPDGTPGQLTQHVGGLDYRDGAVASVTPSSNAVFEVWSRRLCRARSIMAGATSSPW
jgi:hypothetical protein